MNKNKGHEYQDTTAMRVNPNPWDKCSILSNGEQKLAIFTWGVTSLIKPKFCQDWVWPRHFDIERSFILWQQGVWNMTFKAQLICGRLKSKSQESLFLRWKTNLCRFPQQLLQVLDQAAAQLISALRHRHETAFNADSLSLRWQRRIEIFVRVLYSLKAWLWGLTDRTWG